MLVPHSLWSGLPPNSTCSLNGTHKDLRSEEVFARVLVVRAVPHNATSHGSIRCAHGSLRPEASSAPKPPHIAVGGAPCATFGSPPAAVRDCLVPAHVFGAATLSRKDLRRPGEIKSTGSSMPAVRTDLVEATRCPMPAAKLAGDRR